MIFQFVNINAQELNEKLRQYLLENRMSIFKAGSIPTNRDINEMAVSSQYISPTTGWKHSYYNQTYKDIWVYNRLLNIASQGDSVILHYDNQFVPSIDKLGIDERANITPDQALSRACKHIELSAENAELVNTRVNTYAKIVEATFTDLTISPRNIVVTLFWLANESNTSAKLVWNVNIEVPKTNNWWNIRIDANSGEFIEKNNWVVHCDFGAPNLQNNQKNNTVPKNFVEMKSANTNLIANSYTVFDIPLEAPTFGSRTVVSDPYTRFLPFGSGPGLTNGWHEDGTTSYTYTRGNNVLAQDDTANNNETTPGNRPTSAILEFDFPYTQATGTAAANQNAAITNLFYWNNLLHDVLKKYGFDEPSGNFQAYNMGLGGAGNDFVYADAQDGGGTNNANFSTPVDGTNGRMQMYLWSNTTTSPAYQPDGDFDNGIISHEYGHGWSTRLTGGPANSSCLGNTEQMGEGWSDYLALMLTTNWSSLTPTLASANIPRGIGTYALGQATTGAGIRPYRYSYDMVNINSAVTYAGVANSTTFSAPHGIGSIWCTILWDMTWEIIMQDNQLVNDVTDNSVYIGNTAALKLVLEGLRLQKCSPSFVDGRDAILKADELLFNKKYKCSIWKAFARRGVGASASTGTSSADRVVTANYAMPTGVKLEKTVSVAKAPEASVYTYTVKATCDCSPSTVTISDVLPSSVDYIANSASNGGTFASSTVTWANQVFVALEEKTYTYNAEVKIGTFSAPVTAINDNFDGSTPVGGWTTGNTGTSTNTVFFVNSTTYANSGVTSKYGLNKTTTSDFNLTNGSFITLSGPTILSFWHRFNTEVDWDGGVVEYALNGGTTWADLEPYIIQNKYNGIIGATNPDRNGFVGNSNGWIQTLIDLSAFCGNTIKIRFRLINDSSADCGTAPCGWFIDDVSMIVPKGVKTTTNTTSGTGTSNCLEVIKSLPPKLNARVYLCAVDSTTLMMPNKLKNLANFPISDPYIGVFTHVNQTTIDSTTNIVLQNSTGNDEIIDWVFIELRDGTSSPLNVLYTRAALLQKDGDIVDMDGVSPILFSNAVAGNYYITVRHRNHLGFRTIGKITLKNSTTNLFNFTNNSISVNGTNGLRKAASNVYTMIPGDINTDGTINATDLSIWEAQNGVYDDYAKKADLNFDGEVNTNDYLLLKTNVGKFQQID